MQGGWSGGAEQTPQVLCIDNSTHLKTQHPGVFTFYATTFSQQCSQTQSSTSIHWFLAVCSLRNQSRPHVQKDMRGFISHMVLPPALLSHEEKASRSFATQSCC